MSHPFLLGNVVNNRPNHLPTVVDLTNDCICLKECVCRQCRRCPFVRSAYKAIISQHVPMPINAQSSYNYASFCWVTTRSIATSRRVYSYYNAFKLRMFRNAVVIYPLTFPERTIDIINNVPFDFLIAESSTCIASVDLYDETR